MSAEGFEPPVFGLKARRIKPDYAMRPIITKFFDRVSYRRVIQYPLLCRPRQNQ